MSRNCERRVTIHISFTSACTDRIEIGVARQARNNDTTLSFESNTTKKSSQSYRMLDSCSRMQKLSENVSTFLRPLVYIFSPYKRVYALSILLYKKRFAWKCNAFKMMSGVCVWRNKEALKLSTAVDQAVVQIHGYPHSKEGLRFEAQRLT